MPKFNPGDEVVLVEGYSYYDRHDFELIETWIDSFIMPGVRGYVRYQVSEDLVCVAWNGEPVDDGHIPVWCVEHYEPTANYPQFYERKLV